MNFKKYFGVLMLLGFFTACQTSSVQEVHSTLETIEKTTPLTNDVLRVAMQNTSQDNIIDNSSCFMIQFPYVISVDNVQIPINSANDYQLVVTTINASSNDNDIVSIHFPVTVMFKDYSEKILNNQTDFNNAIQQCKTDSNVFGKIYCVTINYPIAINSYDSNYQIASTVSITDNLSLYNFLANLASNKFISISYPITITDQNGQNVVITSNTQLENAIKNAVDTCSGNTVSKLDFLQTITSNSWKISYYFNDDDRTSYYDGYVFTFKSDNTVVATKSGITYNGTWSSNVANGVGQFGIKFNSDSLGKLDETWNLFEFNSSQLRFSSEDGLNENDYLYFEKI